MNDDNDGDEGDDDEEEEDDDDDDGDDDGRPLGAHILKYFTEPDPPSQKGCLSFCLCEFQATARLYIGVRAGKRKVNASENMGKEGPL